MFWQRFFEKFTQQWRRRYQFGDSHGKYFLLMMLAGIGVQKSLHKKPSGDDGDKDKDESLQTRYVKRPLKWLLRKIRLMMPDFTQPRYEKMRCAINSTHCTHRGTFRDITIREYENRLRAHSQPLKVFNYFATIRVRNSNGNWEIYMTPVDFLRSMMPGLRQPENLGLNKFRTKTRQQVKELRYKKVPEDSIFYELRPNGLLSFSDYVYLYTLIPMPERYFEIGFSLFDTQGNGNLGLEEMNKLLVGVAKNEMVNAQNCINSYFFGPKLDHQLSLSKFLSFKRKLINDVLKIEFNMLQNTDETRRTKPNTISEATFANLLITYSTLPRANKVAILKRIKRKYKKSTRGITWEEFRTFYSFIENINAIDSALIFHYFTGADISRMTLKHISNVVVGEPLSAHIIDIIFTVFDTDNNGIVGRTEFIQAINRFSPGKDRHMKITRLFHKIYKCAKRTLLVKPL